MFPVTKPELKICNKDKLHISRRPSRAIWILSGISVLIFFLVFHRFTDNIFVVLILILGEIMFVLDTLGDSEDLILDKRENKAVIHKKVWCDILCPNKSDIVMNLSDIRHVGVSIRLGLFILHRHGKTFSLNMQGLLREEVQVLRKKIEVFLRTCSIMCDIIDLNDPINLVPELRRKYLKHMSCDKLTDNKKNRKLFKNISLPSLVSKKKHWQIGTRGPFTEFACNDNKQQCTRIVK